MAKAIFDLQAPFQPAGDQPKAIAELAAGLERGDRFQTLLGVTGSGKTMTVANVVKHYGRPTLVLSHNKTLAAQLYGELKSFLPHNAVDERVEATRRAMKSGAPAIYEATFIADTIHVKPW